MPCWFVHYLQREAKVYDQLSAIQGKHVPVHLGAIKLELPYYYEGIAALTHMMFMSFAGHQIFCVEIDRSLLHVEVKRSIQAIHHHGVLQCDAEACNILWNDGQVMIVDFERAKVLQPQAVLGELTTNRKRGRRSSKEDGKVESSTKYSSLYARELALALHEAHRCSK